MVLEYRRTKPIKRKSRSNYNEVELSAQTSLNEVYHAQCYKLFTAIKVPADFKKKSATECNTAPEILEKNCEFSIPASTATQIADSSAELSIPSTSATTQVAGTSTDE